MASGIELIAFKIESRETPLLIKASLNCLGDTAIGQLLETYGRLFINFNPFLIAASFASGGNGVNVGGSNENTIVYNGESVTYNGINILFN